MYDNCNLTERLGSHVMEKHSHSESSIAIGKLKFVYFVRLIVECTAFDRHRAPIHNVPV